MSIDSPRIFGRLQVRLDPWQPEFGAEFSLGEDPAAALECTEIDIEHPPADWSPIQPSTGSIRPVWFIDGVRRLEARVTAKLDDSYSYGAFGTFGVGAVRLDAEQACFDRHSVGRVFALSSAELPAREIQIAPALVYLPLRVADSEPDAPVRAIHGQMRTAEEALARELAAGENNLVIADGPLTFEESTRGSAVGYIKRVMKSYLTGPQLTLLTQLKPGERTPLFALKSSTRFSRISWFIRLSEVRKGDSDFSGIVRLEVAESVGLEKARFLAGAFGALLPTLKARRALDRRAPQNLLPIAALENYLRRKLGDERVIRRSIQSFLVSEAA